MALPVWNDLIAYAQSISKMWGWDGANWQPILVDATGKIQTAGGVAVRKFETILGANVIIVNSNTYYDIVSLSLPAGEFDIDGFVQTSSGLGSGGSEITAKLWDGTTVYSSGQRTAGLSGSTVATVNQIIIPKRKVSLAVPTTLKISVASSGGSSTTTVLSACPNNGAGNNATMIGALQYA